MNLEQAINSASLPRYDCVACIVTTLQEYKKLVGMVRSMGYQMNHTATWKYAKAKRTKVFYHYPSTGEYGHYGLEGLELVARNRNMNIWYFEGLTTRARLHLVVNKLPRRNP